VEDDPPNGPDDMQPNLFEFFGFGQPGNVPNAAPPGPQAAHANDAAPDANDDANHNQKLEAEGRGLWPKPEVNAVNPLGAGEAFIEMNDLIANEGPEIDLNEPLEDDLGGIDDLIQIADEMDAQPNFGPHPEDVIDAGLMSDSDSEGQNIQQPPALPHVEVFIPLEQINPDEIQPKELMDHDFEEDDNF